MRSITTLVAGGLSALALLATAAPSTAAELLVNGSFETIHPSAVPEGWGGYTFYAGSTLLTGWTVEAGSVDITNGSSGWSPAADGANSLDINGWTPGTISQSFDTTVGKQYTVTFSYSRNAAGAPDPAKAILTAGASALDISAPNNPAIFGTSWDFKWLPASFTFIGTGNDTLRVAADGGVNGGVFFDKFSVTAVPEPASWALMICGAGMTGLALRRRRGALIA